MLCFVLTSLLLRPLAAQDLFLKPSPTSPLEPTSGWDYLLPRCMDGDQHGWPKFDNQTDLQASPWGKYFELVYGEVPDRGYPICTYGQIMLYRPHLESAGVTPPNIDLSECFDIKAGERYKERGVGSGYTKDWVDWIWNPGLWSPAVEGLPGTSTRVQGLPSGTWVEVFHQGCKSDGSGTWFYYAPGTAIWAWLGNTKTYDDHPTAILDLTDNKPQPGCTSESTRNEDKWCNELLEDLYTGMRNQGIDTVQFLDHSESGMYHNLLEIVDIAGSGQNSCGQDSSGLTRFKAGWGAAHECNCHNDHDVINCDGFGIRNIETTPEPTPEPMPVPPEPTPEPKPCWPRWLRWLPCPDWPWHHPDATADVDAIYSGPAANAGGRLPTGPKDFQTALV